MPTNINRQQLRPGSEKVAASEWQGAEAVERRRIHSDNKTIRSKPTSQQWAGERAHNEGNMGGNKSQNPCRSFNDFIICNNRRRARP